MLKETATDSLRLTTWWVHPAPPIAAVRSAVLVQEARRRNLQAGDAWDWYIDNQSRACVYNAVDMSFEQGVMSFVRPRLFDKDSPDCSPSALGINTDALASSSRRGSSADGSTHDAIPIPGQQDVPCAWDTCGMD